MHNSGSRWGRGCQRLRDGLGDGLRPSQGLHLHRVDVEHIACWENKSGFLFFFPSREIVKLGEKSLFGGQISHAVISASMLLGALDLFPNHST